MSCWNGTIDTSHFPRPLFHGPLTAADLPCCFRRFSEGRLSPGDLLCRTNKCTSRWPGGVGRGSPTLPGSLNFCRTEEGLSYPGPSQATRGGDVHLAQPLQQQQWHQPSNSCSPCGQATFVATFQLHPSSSLANIHWPTSHLGGPEKEKRDSAMIRTLAFGQADRRVASLLGDMDIAAVRQAMFECPPPLHAPWLHCFRRVIWCSCQSILLGNCCKNCRLYSSSGATHLKGHQWQGGK